MTVPSSFTAPAAEAARLILEVYEAYRDQFTLVTRRAAARFAARDWTGGRHDATERLTLYPQFVGWILRDLRRSLGPRAKEPELWRGARAAFAAAVASRPEAELARTFYNSVVRRMLQTVGADPTTEFLGRDRDLAAPPAGTTPELRHYRGPLTNPAVARSLLADLSLALPIDDLPGAAAAVAQAVQVEHPGLHPGEGRVELLSRLFYRNKAAYAVGRFSLGGDWRPLVLAVVHGERGVRLDAVLTSADEASAVFGFTRSYFHVDLDHPRGTIEFLRGIMPAKRLDELYTAIGFNKHGKAVLYHQVLAHLRTGEARFEVAEGEPGLVMCVFALPALNVVFKVIRDRFGPSKRTTAEAVRQKYQLVFGHDRVGRLADAQEFVHLEFERRWFTPEVLEELRAAAAKSVSIDGERVVLRHAYTERRVVPLNLYLQRVAPAGALDAILDYGQAIRDLAAANIFTGDMLLKNFGVTRHGRVICYDYDELCLLTECRFRRLPQSTDPADELRAEPWFHVADEDVFPEEFTPFLVPGGDLREAFLAAHRTLLDVGFWREMQRRQEAGDIVEFFPYRESRRLRPG